MALSNVESESDVLGLEREGGEGAGELFETFGWISRKVSGNRLI